MFTLARGVLVILVALCCCLLAVCDSRVHPSFREMNWHSMIFPVAVLGLVVLFPSPRLSLGLLLCMGLAIAVWISRQGVSPKESNFLLSPVHVLLPVLVFGVLAAALVRAGLYTVAFAAGTLFSLWQRYSDFSLVVVAGAIAVPIVLLLRSRRFFQFGLRRESPLLKRQDEVGPLSDLGSIELWPMRNGVSEPRPRCSGYFEPLPVRERQPKLILSLAEGALLAMALARSLGQAWYCVGTVVIWIVFAGMFVDNSSPAFRDPRIGVRAATLVAWIIALAVRIRARENLKIGERVRARVKHVR